MMELLTYIWPVLGTLYFFTTLKYKLTWWRFVLAGPAIWITALILAAVEAILKLAQRGGG